MTSNAGHGCLERLGSGSAPVVETPGLAMARQLTEAVPANWCCVNSHHLFALVRAGAIFVDGVNSRGHDWLAGRFEANRLRAVICRIPGSPKEAAAAAVQRL